VYGICKNLLVERAEFVNVELFDERKRVLIVDCLAPETIVQTLFELFKTTD
jgi:hypothetical protein